MQWREIGYRRRHSAATWKKLPVAPHNKHACGLNRGRQGSRKSQPRGQTKSRENSYSGTKRLRRHRAHWAWPGFDVRGGRISARVAENAQPNKILQPERRRKSGAYGLSHERVLSTGGGAGRVSADSQRREQKGVLGQNALCSGKVSGAERHWPLCLSFFAMS